MSYVALYRKFRPDTFEEVKGQDPIVQTLKNQIRADRIGHAYLFCGTRGTGKTSVAKVFAKAVNCMNPKDGSPCGECEMCRRIAAGNSLNVVEIDAASNNGVENIRDIVEEVSYRPAEGRFRVYIIDEVHMLSTGAFNALLKTLEEPPSYVIFILATTEVHKIPVTIRSRCQRYDFHRIGTDIITQRLAELTAREGIEAEEKGLAYIARASEGAMRDALSMLDQCSSFLINEPLTYEKVLQVLGAADGTVFRELLTLMAQGKTAGAIAAFERSVGAGKDPVQFVTDYTWYLRNVLLVRTSGEAAYHLIDLPEAEIRELGALASSLSEPMIIGYIEDLSELSSRLRNSTNSKIEIEVELIRLSTSGPKNRNGNSENTGNAPLNRAPSGYAAPVDDGRLREAEMAQMRLMDRIEMLERKIEEMPRQAAPAHQAEMPANAGTPVQAPPEPQYIPPAPEQLKMVTQNWEKIVSQLRDGLVKQMLLTAVPKFDPAENDGILYVEFTNGLAERMAGREELAADLQRITARLFGVRVQYRLHLAGSGKAGLAPVRVEEILKNHIHMNIEEE